MGVPPIPDPELERLAATLEQVAGMDLDGLRRCWRSQFRRAAPAALSRTLLYRALAYRIQADALGELDRATIQALARLADDPGTAAVPTLPELRAMKPGTVLVREWAGALQTVTALEMGFAWQGQSYDSLSAVARAITGTAWNGPRFFGLRKGPTASAPVRVARKAHADPLPARQTQVSATTGSGGPRMMGVVPAGASV